MILVTGGTGKIGRELVRELKARKTSFKVMVRAKEAISEFASRGITAVLGDFGRPDSFPGALSGIRTVFLLTTPNPEAVATEQRFLTACKSSGVERIVRVSVQGANPWAASCLLRSHGRCESQLEVSGLRWTLLRPTIFMQNLAPAMGPSVAKESTLYAPAGHARMPWVDTRDIASVAAKVLTSEGHDGLVYELTGPETHSYEDIAGILSEQLNRHVTYVNVPDGAARQAMVDMGMSPWLAEGMITLYHVFRVNTATSLVLETVERIGGQAPRTLPAYLKETEASFTPQQTVPVTRR
jgi:uncharacterized protein YbjT (DUF2867 family)